MPSSWNGRLFHILLPDRFYLSENRSLFRILISEYLIAFQFASVALDLTDFRRYQELYLCRDWILVLPTFSFYSYYQLYC